MYSLILFFYLFPLIAVNMLKNFLQNVNKLLKMSLKNSFDGGFYNLRNRFLIKQSVATKVISHYPLRIKAVILSFGMWPNQPLDS